MLTHRGSNSLECWCGAVKLKFFRRISVIADELLLRRTYRMGHRLRRQPNAVTQMVCAYLASIGKGVACVLSFSSDT